MKGNCVRCFVISILSLAIIMCLGYMDSKEVKVYASDINSTQNTAENKLYNFKIITGEKLINEGTEAPNVYKADVMNNEYKINIQFEAKSGVDTKKFIITGSDNSIVGSISGESPFIITSNLKEGENTISIKNKNDNNEIYKFYINYKSAEINGLSSVIKVGDTCKLGVVSQGKECPNVQWKSIGVENAMISKDGDLIGVNGGIATIIGTIYDENNKSIIGSLSVQCNIIGEGKFGWIKNAGNWYYIDSETKNLHTGWLFYNNEWYYFQSDGALKLGWLYLDKTWYYIKQTGNMATSWIKDNGKWYLMDGSGAMKTGWVKDHGNWYYLNSDGSMQTSEKEIDGKIYKFNGNGELQK